LCVQILGWIKFFFFLHNEVRDEGWGVQRSILGYKSLIRRVRAAQPEPSKYSLNRHISYSSRGEVDTASAWRSEGCVFESRAGKKFYQRGKGRAAPVFGDNEPK